MWYIQAENGKPIIGHQQEPAEGLIEISDETMDFIDLHGDWLWNGETVVEPPPVPEPLPYTPTMISMRQCQLYLYDMGTLAAIEAVVLTLSDKAQIEWRTSKDVWRSSPMVEQMRIMFNWSVDQMDQMFRDAEQL
jgi:hypothetical protein